VFCFILFYTSFVCIYAYANVYFKTTIIKQTILLVGVIPNRGMTTI